MPKVRSQHNQLRELTLQRRGDADVLFRNKRWRGSVYLVGYSVECALKAAICRGLREKNLRDELAVHDLYILVGSKALKGVPRIALWQLMQIEPGVMASFERMAATWSSEMRYETTKMDREMARQALEDATTVTDWLNRQYVGELL